MKRALLLLLAACECGSPSTPPEPEGPPLTAAELFPMHAGDRWALTSGEETSLLVVTALTPEGVGVFFGSDRTSAERYRVGERGVELVAPDGTVLAPFLDTPVALGHEWSYELGDSRCVATYATVGESAEIAGTRLEGCVEVRRRCELPEGKPFPNATAQIHEELWCPAVGRVKETVRFRPAPTIEGFPAEKTWTARYYRVQDAPALALPRPLDCAHFLLASTDVQAACGPALRPAGAADVGGACHVRFTGPGGVLEVRARRFDAAPDSAAIDTMLESGDVAVTSEGELRVFVGEAAPSDDPPPPDDPAPSEGAEAAPPAPHGYALVEGDVAVALRGNDAVCTAERARRLEPLLRSLVRP
ncbi:MAG: hypothetical protein H6721_17990 [Sandaracinus sp.]|nr:hypothetical protein [Sandaracinus sp.]MCB9634015.1 hypothetical protein [Sandaracinus sp.]